MTGATTPIEALYKVRKGLVEFVDVPELAYLVVEGQGAPDSPGFAAAVQCLYTVSYGARFLVKKAIGEAPRVMPLEALWWVDDAAQQDIVEAVVVGKASMIDTDRDRWHWRAMIMQLDPVDEPTIAAAIEQARKKLLPALDGLRFHRWEEGRCAQILHIGPYADEPRSLVRLHAEITAAGYRPHGRHHEIYLGDPRRAAPEKLRTILRHPIEPTSPD